MTDTIFPVKCVQINDVSKYTFQAGHNVGYEPGAPMPYFYQKQINKPKMVTDPDTGEQIRVMPREVVYLTKEQLARTKWKTTHIATLVNNNNQPDTQPKTPIIPMPDDRFQDELAAANAKKTKKRKRSRSKSTTKRSKPAKRKTRTTSKSSRTKKQKKLVPPKPADDGAPATLEPPKNTKRVELRQWTGYDMLYCLLRTSSTATILKLKQCVEGERCMDDPAILGSIFKDDFCPSLKKLDRIPYLHDIPGDIDMEHRGQAREMLKLGANLVLHIYAEKLNITWHCSSLDELMGQQPDLNHAAVKFALMLEGMKSPQTWTTFCQLCALPKGDGEPNKQLAACALLGMLIAFLWYVMQ